MPGLICYDFRDGHYSHQYCSHVDRIFQENPTVQLFTFYKDLFVYSQCIDLSGDQYILSLQRTPTNENNGGTEWRGIQQLLRLLLLT